MIRYKNIEVTIGLFMILAFTALIFVTVQTTSFSMENKDSSYFLRAKFDDASGLRKKAPVRIAGVKIGEIQHIKLDETTYQADTQVIIYDKNVQIPQDSSISILTEGILGSKYVQISPGYDEAMLKDGDTIAKTYSGIILENILSQAITAFTSKE